MKITRETLKKMIAEEVAKMDPQNEGFMDAVKGMGRQAGAALGMQTDPKSKQFLGKVSAIVGRIDPELSMQDAEGVDIAFLDSQEGAKESLDIAERSIAFRDAEDAKRQISHAEQGKKMLDAWENSPSGQEAASVGNIYSPNSGLMYALGAAADYFDTVRRQAQIYMDQAKTGKRPERQSMYKQYTANESYLSTSLNNLKKVVAEEIIKMELDNKGK